MESSLINQEADLFLEKVKAYLPVADLVKLREALLFAQKAHHGQLRKSGEAYILHPLRTAEILSHFHVDEDTLVAALLHDVPEDTTHTLDEVERRFGKKISYLVDGVTKLSKVHYRHDMEQRQIESLKKMFIHSAEDLRVILIKLADRLHNMRTMQFIVDEKKRERISRETLEIYVPIANLLGINEIKVELEDLCFQHLWPNEFVTLKKELEENEEERSFILDEMIHLAHRELKKHAIDAEIFGRTKTLYSTYRKLKLKKTVSNIDDLLAVRLVVPTRKDCYAALGIIHRLFKPKMGRFKDYIAVPKPNGYQSIHTTVFGINSSIVEFQVRTRYMHLEAEYGVAAHYFYKYSSENELAEIMRQRANWVQRILEIQQEQNTKSFLENLKVDVFQDRIFLFTPKGDVIDLPQGATVIDFAYAIHTDIGNHALKAEINGMEYPLHTALSTSDTVRIVTSKERTIERDWLNYVKTATAYNKIKIELKKLPHEEKMVIGRRILQKEFDLIGSSFLDELTSKRMKLISNKFPFQTIEELLLGLGEGQINPRDIINVLYEKDPLYRNKPTFFRIREEKNPNLKKTAPTRVSIRIIGANNKGQFREILRVLTALQVPIVKFSVNRPWYLDKDRCRLTLLVKNFDELSQISESLEQIEGVEVVTRRFAFRKLLFYLGSLATLGFWVLHPVLIRNVLDLPGEWGDTAQQLFLYGGIFLLFGLIMFLKRLTQRSFPELHETKLFWITILLLNTFALGTILGEIFFFNITLHWVTVFGLILAAYAYLAIQYLRTQGEPTD